MSELKNEKRTKIKWYCNIDGNILFISEDMNVYWFKCESDIIKLNQESHNNRIVFRLKGTTKRIGKKKIRNNSKRCNILI